MRTENQDLTDIGGTRGTGDHIDGARQRSDAEGLTHRSELLATRRARCHFQRALLSPRQRREARIVAAACFHWQILRSQER